jgi:hypothetical protein
VGTFKEYAWQYEFDQAERQLALLRMLTSHIPNEDLQVSLVALESLLAQCKGTKAEEQRNTDKKLATAKQEAVREVREEMGQEPEKLKEQLEKARTRSNQSEQNITINIEFQVGKARTQGSKPRYS